MADAAHALANSDSFWFNVDGPLHVGTDAEAGAHFAASGFAALSDVFADQFRGKRRGDVYQRRVEFVSI